MAEEFAVYEEETAGSAENLTLIVAAEDAGERLDAWLSGKLEGRTRSFIQKLIADGNVTVGGAATGKKDKNLKLAAGKVITVSIPEPESLDLQPENIPLDMVYEDEDLLVVNKPKGMVVQPAPGNYTGTLVQALL